MFKLIDKVVGEICKSRNKEVILDIIGERRCEYGKDDVRVEKLNMTDYEMTLIKK